MSLKAQVRALGEMTPNQRAAYFAAEAKRREAVYRQHSGVPLRFQGHSLGCLQPASEAQKGALDAVLSWYGDGRGPLIVAGPTGTGKTTLAAAMLRAFVVDVGWESSLFVTAGGVVDRVRRAWRSAESREEDADVMGGLVNRHALAIDDLRAATEADARIFTSLVERAYDEGRALQLIVTTALSPAGLAKLLGPRAYDMLRDGATLVTLEGPSLRTPAAAPAAAPVLAAPAGEGTPA